MIVVVDSGVANLTSVMAALQRLGAEAAVSADAKVIGAADRVVLPGVGAAAAAMENLKAKNMVDVLRGLTQPVLGICLGMQILFERSEESGGVACLGILPGLVKQLPSSSDMPVPHMGWNSLQCSEVRHPLLKNIDDDSCVYFVHSYAAPVSELTMAKTMYSCEFTAVAAKKNFMGCQFHPERSGVVGQQILRNFLEL